MPAPSLRTPNSLQLQENVALAPYTTLGIGGPARFLAEITAESQLLQAVQFARSNHLPIFVLGGGSNLLVADSGFPGLVLHTTIEGPLERRASGQHVELAVPGGTDWDAFVLLACEGELSGVECLAGIPGLTGGSPVQNIGAYGQEVADTILHVRAFDLETDRFVQLSNADCGFSYRSSVFNSSARGRYIITAVTFRFDPGARPRLTYADLTRHFAGREPSPMEVYHAVREIRRAKGMLLVPGDPDCRSAGSFFKNPVVPTAELDHIAGELGLAAEAVPHWPAPSLDNGSHAKLAAAWLLERAGFTKGFTLGNAGISSRHTLALINRGGASYADLVALRERIRSEVHARFGIMLEQEPVELGA